MSGRCSDRIEALVLMLLMAAGLATVWFGFWAGHAMAHSLASAGPDLEAGEYVVSATVTGSIVGPARDGFPAVWTTHVVWTRPNGAPGHGSVQLDRPAEAGERTTIVVDSAGHPRSKGALDVVTSTAVTVGVTAVLVSWVLLTLIWTSVGSLLARCRAAALAAEWERVEPTWSGRSR